MFRSFRSFRSSPIPNHQQHRASRPRTVVAGLGLMLAGVALGGCYKHVTRADGFARYSTGRVYDRADSDQRLTNKLLGPIKSRETGGTMRAWSKTEPYRYRAGQASMTTDEVNDR